jgi:steroid 5-alpha reductase family enzyme
LAILGLIGYSFLILWGYMTLAWLVSLIRREASVARVADVFWGLGFVVLTWVFFTLTDGSLPRKLLVCGLTMAWGIRLAAYIVVRTWGKGEDPRYQPMRDAAGESFWWKRYFQVFLLQGFLLGLVAAPLLASQFFSTPEGLTVLDIAGAVVWAIGFLFETVGDWQLYLFKRDPANQGKVLRRGLWAYTRHPNYFGETLMWWGIFLIALATPYGYWSAYGPLVITFLLLRVSGVTLLERNLVDTKPEYRQYMESTSAFIPWFPRKPG